MDEEDSPAPISYGISEEQIESWSPSFFALQTQAPKANCIIIQSQIAGYVKNLNMKYHNPMTEDEAAAKLQGEDNGSYIVHSAVANTCVVSLKCSDDIYHHTIKYNKYQLFLEYKTFDSIEDLVNDTLINLYMEATKNIDYCLTLGRTKQMNYKIRKSLEGTTCVLPRTRTATKPSKSEMRSNLDRRNSKSAESLLKPLAHLNHKKDYNKSGALFGLIQSTLVSGGTTYQQAASGKTHNFVIHTYSSFNWCDICHHFLWGVKQQGYQCKDCGINAHRACHLDISEIDNVCIPNKKMVNRVFGASLTALVLVEKRSVPLFIEQCVNEIEGRGLNTEGIYRVPGKATSVVELKDAVDNGVCPSLSEIDMHVIGAALKLFFREMPDPLISYAAYPFVLSCLSAESIPDTLYAWLQQSLHDNLPKAHYDLLKYLLYHLHRVSECNDTNKMTAKNLAVVFSPTIMRSPNETDELKDLPYQQKIVEILILHTAAIFEIA